MGGSWVKYLQALLLVDEIGNIKVPGLLVRCIVAQPPSCYPFPAAKVQAHIDG